MTYLRTFDSNPGFSTQAFYYLQELTLSIQTPFDDKSWMGYSVIVITELVNRGMTLLLLGVGIVESAIRLGCYPGEESTTHSCLGCATMVHQLLSSFKKLDPITLLGTKTLNTLTSLKLDNQERYLYLYFNIFEPFADALSSKPEGVKQQVARELSNLSKFQKHLLPCIAGIEPTISSMVPSIRHQNREERVNQEILDNLFAEFNNNAERMGGVPVDRPLPLSPYIKDAIIRLKTTKQPYMTEELRENLLGNYIAYQNLVHFLHLYYIQNGSNHPLFNTIEKLPTILTKLLEQMVLEGNDYTVPKLIGVDLDKINPIVSSIQKMNLSDNELINLHDVIFDDKIQPLPKVNEALVGATELMPFEKWIMASMLYKEPLFSLRRQIQDDSPPLDNQTLKNAIISAIQGLS